MANKNRDVELVIRAKNEASKAISAVTSGLKNLSDAQDAAGKSADSAGSQLGKFAKEARTLQENLSNLRQIDRTTTQVDRLTTSITKTQAELASLNAQVDKAAAEQARLSDVSQRTKAALDTQTAATAAADAALKQSNTTLAAAERRYASLLAEVKAAKSPTDQLKNALRDQLNTVMALVVAQGNAVSVKQRETAAEKALGKELASVNNDLKNAQGNQNDLAAAIAKANGSIESQIEKIRELQAATRMTRPAETVSVTSGMSAYGAQIKALGDAQRAYGAARAEVARLTKEISGVAQPTAQMTQALELARAKSEQHRLAVQREGLVLSTVKQQALDTARARKSAAQAAAEEANAVAQANAKKAAEASASQATAAAKEREAAANKAATAAHEKTTDAARRSLDMHQRLRGQVLSMIAAYVGVPAIVAKLNEVTKAYQTLEAVQNRLGVTFGGDTGKVAEEIDFLRRNADRLKTSFQVLSDEYSKFAVATKDTILQGQETRRIFISVAEAGRVNKLSTEQMSRVFLALTQMISKGKIQAEELRQQLGDALPGAMQILAAGMGKTTAELDKMMNNGEVTIDNLSKFATQLDKRFGDQLTKSLQSVTSSMGDFENASYQAKLQFAQGGFIDALQKALDRLTDYLRSAEAAELINNISSATGGLISTLSHLPQYFRPIMVMVSALVGYKLAAAFIGWRTSMVAAQAAMAAGTTTVAGLTAATNASRVAIIGAAAATRSWSVLLSAAGGPIGVLITGASALLAIWMTRTNDVTEAMTQHRDIVDKVKNAYDKADKSSKNWAENIKGVTKIEAAKNLNDMKKAYGDLVDEMDATGNRFRSTLSMPTGHLQATDALRRTRQETTDVLMALNDLKTGQITITEFRERLDKLNETVKNKAVREWIAKLDEMAKGSLTAEKNLGEAEKVMRILTGTTDEAAKAGKELAGSFDEIGSSVDGTKDKIDAYKAALNKLKGGIPELKAEANRESALEELKKDTAAVLADGPPTREFAELVAKRYQAILDEFEKEVFDGLKAQANGDSSLRRSFDLIVQKEGFREKPYWDVNAYRAGYGSDTTTLSDGTIKKITQGMTVTRSDSDRDLIRRIGDFQDVIKGQIGNERFSAFDNDQQAALTSIAYNYGSLPKRILEAVRSGSSAEIASAVRGLKGDNKGINSGRRESEARLIESSSSAGLQKFQLAKDRKEEEAAEKKALEQQEALLKKRREANRELDSQIEGLGQAATEQEIINKLSDLKLAKDSEEGIALADKIRKKNEERDLQQTITDLQAQQSSLQTQITYATQQGDYQGAERLKEQLKQVNDQLAIGVQAAIVYWQNLGGPSADAAIAKLKSINTQTENLSRKFLQTGQQIDETLSGNMTNGLASVAEAIANGEDALGALGDALRQVAAEFLLNIGKMIAQQAIFNALQNAGFAGGNGFGNGVMGLVSSLFHSGGTAGFATQGTLVNPSVFSGAAKYHTGGVAGLKSNEIPAILERGETIRTEEQESALQARMGGGVSQPNIKIVNAIDAGDMVSQGLGTEVGEKAILNFMRANRSAVKGALG